MTVAPRDLVAYIRADETPHVDYLRTALTEMRDRTFVGESGAKIPGTEVVGTLWDTALGQSLGANRESFVRQAMGEVEHALAGQPAPRRHPRGVRRARKRASSRRGGAMKFGIFYEHQLPAPVDRGLRVPLIQDALDQIEYADSLGIDYAWEVEHHFLEEYSHSSAPEVFLAAASQRTKNIRLGHGIVQTPPPFNHPARIAERISMLDLVSGGRADFGTGESSSEAELGGFMVDPERKRAMWEEGSARRGAVHDRVAVHRSLGRVRHDAAPQRRAQAAPEAASAVVGRVQPPRDDPPRRRRKPSARSRSRSSIPKKRSSGSTTTTRHSKKRRCRSATR